jgi:hypothetical protein
VSAAFSENWIFHQYPKTIAKPTFLKYHRKHRECKETTSGAKFITKLKERVLFLSVDSASK